MDLTDRHPSVAQVVEFFDFGHLPPHLAEISKLYADLAEKLLDALPDDPELTVALRKLVESKDSAVRTAVRAHRAATPTPA